MAYLFDVPEYKKVRVIIDTDAACEADDPFAIVQALLSPKLIVKGIVAEHFNVPGSMDKNDPGLYGYGCAGPERPDRSYGA